MQTGRQYRAAIPRGMPADEPWSRQSPMRVHGFIDGGIIPPGVPIVWGFGPSTEAVFDAGVTGFTWNAVTTGGVGVYNVTLSLRPRGSDPGYLFHLVATPQTTEPGRLDIGMVWLPPTVHTFLEGVGVLDFAAESGTATYPFVFPCTLAIQAVRYHDEP